MFIVAFQRCYCDEHDQSERDDQESQVDGNEDSTPDHEDREGDEDGEDETLDANSEEEHEEVEEEESEETSEESAHEDEIETVDLTATSPHTSLDVVPVAGPSRLAVQAPREGVIKWVKDGEVKPVDLANMLKIGKVTSGKMSKQVVASNDQRKKLRPRPERQNAGGAGVETHGEPNPGTSARETKGALKKEHECDICKKRFPQRYRLVRHARTHKESNFICEKCGYRCRDMKTLNFHRQRYHAGKRALKCGTCGLVVSCLSNLKRHIKLHEGVGKFPCETCGRVFSRMDTKKRHMRARHANSRK